MEKTDTRPENFYIEVSRDGYGATVIIIRSKRIEAMMREWANSKTFRLNDVATTDQIPMTGLHPDQKFYKFAQDPMLPSGRRWNAPHNGVVVGVGNVQHFNLRYFALVGLGDGVTIRLAVPLSMSMIKELVASADTAANELLQEFAKPVKVSQTIFAKESKETTNG